MIVVNKETKVAIATVEHHASQFDYSTDFVSVNAWHFGHHCRRVAHTMSNCFALKDVIESLTLVGFGSLLGFANVFDLVGETVARIGLLERPMLMTFLSGLLTQRFGDWGSAADRTTGTMRFLLVVLFIDR